MTSPTPIKTRTIVSLPPELLENVLSSTLDNFAQAADRQRFRLCSLAFVCKAFYNIAKSIDKHLLILPSAKAAQTYLESGREGDREGVTALHIALELDWVR